MKTIRRNTFETNSSSCHCVTIVKPVVYKAILEKTAVLHPKYLEAFEGESIEVFCRESDLYSIWLFHKEFLEEIKDSPDVEPYITNMDSYWKGLSNYFTDHINDIEFFRSLIFFDSSSNFPYDLSHLKKNDKESNKSPAWILAWIFRGICYELGFSFDSFNLDFEDSNVKFSEFKLMENGNYIIEHNISC